MLINTKKDNSGDLRVLTKAIGRYELVASFVFTTRQVDSWRKHLGLVFALYNVHVYQHRIL